MFVFCFCLFTHLQTRGLRTNICCRPRPLLFVGARVLCFRCRSPGMFACLQLTLSLSFLVSALRFVFVVPLCLPSLACISPAFSFAVGTETPGLQHRVCVIGVLLAVRGVYGRILRIFRKAVPNRGYRCSRGSHRRLIRGEAVCSGCNARMKGSRAQEHTDLLVARFTARGLVA